MPGRFNCLFICVSQVFFGVMVGAYSSIGFIRYDLHFDAAKAAAPSIYSIIDMVILYSVTLKPDKWVFQIFWILKIIL